MIIIRYLQTENVLYLHIDPGHFKEFEPELGADKSYYCFLSSSLGSTRNLSREEEIILIGPKLEVAVG